MASCWRTCCWHSEGDWNGAGCSLEERLTGDRNRARSPALVRVTVSKAMWEPPGEREKEEKRNRCLDETMERQTQKSERKTAQKRGKHTERVGDGILSARRQRRGDETGERGHERRTRMTRAKRAVKNTVIGQAKRQSDTLCRFIIMSPCECG